MFTILGVQDRVAVKHPLRNQKDVGSNPATARNENWTLGEIYQMCYVQNIIHLVFVIHLSSSSNTRQLSTQHMSFLGN